MEKYITYYKPDENKYYIEKTIVKYNNLGRPTIHGGYIINEICIFDNLEDAYNSLKKTSHQIIDLTNSQKA